jgi:hypothetical protein
MPPRETKRLEKVADAGLPHRQPAKGFSAPKGVMRRTCASCSQEEHRTRWEKVRGLCRIGRQKGHAETQC